MFKNANKRHWQVRVQWQTDMIRWKGYKLPVFTQGSQEGRDCWSPFFLWNDHYSIWIWEEASFFFPSLLNHLSHFNNKRDDGSDIDTQRQRETLSHRLKNEWLDWCFPGRLWSLTGFTWERASDRERWSWQWGMNQPKDRDWQEKQWQEKEILCLDSSEASVSWWSSVSTKNVMPWMCHSFACLVCGIVVSHSIKSVNLSREQATWGQTWQARQQQRQAKWNIVSYGRAFFIFHSTWLTRTKEVSRHQDKQLDCNNKYSVQIPWHEVREDWFRNKYTLFMTSSFCSFEGGTRMKNEGWKTGLTE